MEKFDLDNYKSKPYFPCVDCEDCDEFRFTEDNELCRRCDYFIAYQLLKEIVGAEDRCRFCEDREMLDSNTICRWRCRTTDECPDLRLDLEAIYDACTME